jgi:hypothetical protein
LQKYSVILYFSASLRTDESYSRRIANPAELIKEIMDLKQREIEVQKQIDQINDDLELPPNF